MASKLHYFFAGVSSILSLFPSIPSFGSEPAKDDRAAMADDWRKVGDDIRCATQEHGKQKVPE